MRWSAAGLLALATVGAACTAAGAEPEWLAGLPTYNPASLCTAQERFVSQFSPGTAAQDRAVFELWDFYDETVRTGGDVVERFGEALSSSEQMEDLVTAVAIRNEAERRAALARFPRVHDRIRAWERCGYAIGAAWDYGLELNPDPLFLRKLGDRLRPDVRAYVELFLRDNPQRLEFDGALALPLDRLRSRIRRWEAFRAEHAGVAPLAAHIDRQLKTMFEYYLCGADNTQLYGGDGRIEEFARESYEQFLAINKSSREYGFMTEAVRILKRHGWRLSAELIRLYESRGYRTDALQSLVPGGS